MEAGPWSGDWEVECRFGDGVEAGQWKPGPGVVLDESEDFFSMFLF